jgi:hypothetical protein
MSIALAYLQGDNRICKNFLDQRDSFAYMSGVNSEVEGSQTLGFEKLGQLVWESMNDGTS